jgi:hypothetical protein
MLLEDIIIKIRAYTVQGGWGCGGVVKPPRHTPESYPTA